jgi:thioesterase domain-containing protein
MPHVPPTNALEHLLAGIWAEVLRIDRAGIHDNFFELGGDSLLSVRLCSRISSETGKHLAPAILFTHPTISEISQWLSSRAPVRTAYRIPLRSVREARHRVAFMPTVLGSGVYHSKLAQRLQSDVDVQTCRLPGTEPDEVPLTSIEQLAAHCRQQLVTCEPSSEWSLVGWSFGGILAYETARQMAAHGNPVRCLILIDTLVETEPQAGDEENLSHTFSSLAAAHHLPPDQPDGSPQLTQPASHSAALFRLYQANVKALHAYTAASSCDVPVTVIRTEESVLLTRSHAVRFLEPSDSRVITIPGDHFSVFSQEHLPLLARAVNEALGTSN